MAKQKPKTAQEKRLLVLNQQSTDQLTQDYEYWKSRAKESRAAGKQDKAAERNEREVDRVLDMRLNSG